MRHVGDHFQRGGDLPKIARDRLLLQQQLQAHRLDAALHLIDLRIDLRNPRRQRLVSFHQRSGCERNRFLAQRSHFNQFPVEKGELLIKTASH